ncbi:ATP-dependent DNA ligase [Krasilnikoviella flava]|uniref:DNA ligase (ATP) n=1 Tax=Krasilnikoviella flava TaxID=526729 RepID=A0A1T5KVQ0_9MICO|nr:ATP-dependent DNA ligase [Krasilnikoviella flava]SKC67777.1 bifunctional non-homologous end joining protein LigD [Krasilnikoviella flava]
MARTSSSKPQTVTVDDRRLQLTNLDKVYYPATGTTKGEVLQYLAQVAPALLRHASHRPATRKRWPDGVAGQMFFQKNLDASTPSWVPRRSIRHRTSTNDYVLVNDLATLTWLGQTATLEIHVPQWRFGRTGTPLPPDRLVLDLDPGPGAGLAECAEVARLARDILRGMDLEPLPVTSGSKGIHLYAALTGHDESLTADAVSAVAHELARHLESEHPDLVVSDMKKSLRAGKVLVDWSQNNGAKTTIAPYSLRGRDEPTVAAPRSWAELEDPGLRQLSFTEVVERLERDGDLLEPLAAGHLAQLEPTPERMATFERTPAEKLETYRAKRDPDRTPEPFGAPDVEPVETRVSTGSTNGGPTFVIQEHHARRLHWDFRLEHEGVLVSWALPRGEPTDPKQNHLAVQTEDHPLEYGSFEGSIPAGEYGGGEVTIWDAGTYDLEKWREGEVIATLHSDRRGSRRLALIRTGGRGGDDENSWLIHRTKAQPGDEAGGDSGDGDGDGDGDDDGAPPGRRERPTPAAPAAAPRPMLATTAPAGELARLDPEDWSFEVKWDGFRAVVEVLQVSSDGDDERTVRLTSRSGQDLTVTFPELQALGDMVSGDDLPLALDGEIVALDADGRPSFRRLQQRANLTRPRDVEKARRGVGVDLVLFDALVVGGRALTGRPYTERRAELARVVDPRRPVHVPDPLEGTLDEALETSRLMRLEGVVAKRRGSQYTPGHRSRDWLKIKHARTQEVVVVGWRPLHAGTGREDARVAGSLLLAVPDDGGVLRYVGKVGTGFKEADRRDVVRRLRPVDDAPLAGVPRAEAVHARWAAPERVAEVTYGDWTSDPADLGAADEVGDEGPRLRHSVWRGWREDKRPGDVVVER